MRKKRNKKLIVFAVCLVAGSEYLIHSETTLKVASLSKGCHLDVVRGPSTPYDPESDAGGSLSSWQSHPSW
jgi:hypothetical protein